MRPYQVLKVEFDAKGERVVRVKGKKKLIKSPYSYYVTSPSIQAAYTPLLYDDPQEPCLDNET